MLDAPWRVTFETNPDDCNLACVMCEEHSPYSPTKKLRLSLARARRRMDPAVFRTVFAELAGSLREVLSTSMGEPLLYEHFEEIIDLCRRQGARLSLLTNGTFPRGGARYWAGQFVRLDCDLKVSLNGATAATQEAIMRGASLDRVIDNLQTLLALRDASRNAGGPPCRVSLKVTFMEANLAELPDIVRLAARLGIDRVRGHHLLSLFDQTAGQPLDRDEAARGRFNRVVAECHRVAQLCPRPDGRLVELDNFTPLGDPSLPRGACPFLGQEAWIDVEGNLAPCCLPDHLRQKLGEFGNVGREGFLAVWNGPAYQRFCRDYLDNPLCQGCGKRRPEHHEGRLDP